MKTTSTNLFKHFWLLLLIAIISICILHAQNETTPTYASHISSCNFKKFSIELTPDGKKELDLITLFIENDFDENEVGDCYFIVKPYYCEEESKRDKFIGVKRAKIVLDHLIEKTKYPAGKFLIQDYDLRFKSNYSQIGCSISTVSFYVISK